jgi:hypothetical protein
MITCRISWFTLCVMLALANRSAAQPAKVGNATPLPGELVPSLKMGNGALELTLKDNAESPQVLSGVQTLVHRQAAPMFTAFDPDGRGTAAGLNFEHIISGHPNPNNRFTPRNGPFLLYRLSDTSAVLVRKREDCPWDISSTLKYTLTDPHAIDFEFRCMPHDAARFGARGYAIFFFANYMNDVIDPALHFRGVEAAGGEEKWISADAPKEHVDWNKGGTYRASNAAPTEYDADHNFRLNSWSYDYPRFTRPFYYGRAAHDMVLMLMFDRSHSEVDEVRFSLFKFKLPAKPRPAWDFQYVIHRIEAEREYGFRGRLVWKKWVSEQDCLQEYGRFAEATRLPLAPP